MLVEIVRSVVTQFAAHLPSGFELIEADGVISGSSPAGIDVFYLMANIESRLTDGWPVRDALKETLLQFAIDLQDAVTEYLTVPWPADGAARWEFAEPGVRMTNNAAVVWYGPEAAPVVGPIRIPLPPALGDLP